MKNHISPLIIFLFGIILFLLFFQVAAASSYKAKNAYPLPFTSPKIIPTEDLIPNKIYTRKLKGGEKHVFSISGEEGKYLHLVIEQKGIDVMIVIKGANGEIMKKVDRPSGSYGRETVTFFVPKTDTFEIEISTWLTEAVVGTYQITYVEKDSVAETDRKWDLAENLTSEAEDLRGAKTKENKEKALEKFSEALKIWQDLGDSYEQAVVYYGMGYTNYALSNNYEAAILYNRALKLHLEKGDEIGQAINQAALGSVQYALNENEFAAYNYKRAIEIYKKIDNLRGLGIVFHGLGTVQLLSENYDEAKSNLMESLKWRVLANDSLGKARTHITLGKLYLAEKNFEKAEEQFFEAEKTLGKERAKEDAELLYYWGRFYLLTGQTDKAAEYLKKGINLSNEAGNKLGEAHGLLDLSRAQMKLGEMEKSLVSIQTALGLVEILRQATLDFRLRVNFSATIQPFYEHYISLLMKMHEREPGKRFDKKALEISEQARARGLLDQMERRSLIRQNRIKPELLEREQFLRDKLTNLLAFQAADLAKQITKEIQEVSAQFSDVDAEINRQFYKPESVFVPTSKTDEIQNNLDENTVLLEYSLSGEDSFVWVVLKNEIFSYRVPGGEIEKLARNVYDCISRLSKPALEKPCWRENEKLSKILLQPLMKHIMSRRLIIVKSSFLHYIPFSSLINPLNSKYLIETNEILTLSSASLLSFIRETKNQNAPAKKLAIFADPVYSSSDARIQVKSKTAPQKGIYDLPRLFASRFEAERISSLLPLTDVLVKKDFEASRDSFFSSNLDNYQILHFAAHAFANDKQPELSSIALSFYNEQGEEVQGFLRTNDILRLNLNSDLVVLSACQTGLGKQIKGEGIVSLGQSFFSVGTKRLIVSLWDVDDKVTAELMSKFYQKHLIEKRNISSSLREAQLEILRDNRWKSPFYWAAFTLEGDW
jgi:CHAT domain-containing protein